MTEQPNSGLAKFGVSCVTTLAVLFGLIFLAGLLNTKKKLVDVQLTGRVDPHFFAGPTFELAVWHQHPGNLRNGKLSVWVIPLFTALSVAFLDAALSVFSFLVLGVFRSEHSLE